MIFNAAGKRDICQVETGRTRHFRESRRQLTTGSGKSSQAGKLYNVRMCGLTPFSPHPLIENTPAADATRSFAYTHNNAGQRTRVTREDGSYWHYEYDALGQVT